MGQDLASANEATSRGQPCARRDSAHAHAAPHAETTEADPRMRCRPFSSHRRASSRASFPISTC